MNVEICRDGVTCAITEAPTVYARIGDIVTMPNPRRRWWAFWRPRFLQYRVTGIC